MTNPSDVQTTYTTNESGQFTVPFTALVENGTYTLTETSAPSAYIVDTTVHTFTKDDIGLSPDSGDSAATRVSNTKIEYEIVNNKYPTAQATVLKTDEDGVALEGATFALYEWSRTENDWVEVTGGISPSNISSVWTTSAASPIRATADNLGRYKIMETSAPNQYFGNWSQEFTLGTWGVDDNIITGQNKHFNFSFSAMNEKKENRITIEKVDQDDHSKKLKGAQFTLYKKIADGDDSEGEESGGGNQTPLEGAAYAVLDSTDGSLTFFRDTAGKYTNNQSSGTKTYYTGFEETTYTAPSLTPWYNSRSSILTITIEDEIRPVSTAYLFSRLTNLQTITGLENLNTSNATNMAYMFNMCRKLSNIDVSTFDTSSATSMRNMFGECQAMTSLDLSSFDTSNVTDMGYMFYSCIHLEDIDLSSFDTSSVTDMQQMFRNDYELETIYATDSFTVGSSTRSTQMFYNCDSLVGGNGTAYSSVYVSDKTYAVIDTSETPGYFTYKVPEPEVNEISGYKKVDVFTTNNIGLVVIEDLLGTGEYILKETKAPDEYFLNQDNVLEFTVNEDGTITVGSNSPTRNVSEVFEDRAYTPSMGSVRIKKYKEDGTTSFLTDEILGGAETVSTRFFLDEYTDGNYEVYDELAYDPVEDEFYLENIAITAENSGIFRIRETSTKDGYSRIIYIKQDGEYVSTGSDTYGFQFDTDPAASKDLAFEIKNVPNKLKITKLDGDTEEPLAGAQFRIAPDVDPEELPEMSDEEYEEFKAREIITDTTDSNGEVTVSRILPGYYVVDEVIAPDSYAVAPDMGRRYLTVNEDGTMYLSGTSSESASYEQSTVFRNQHCKVRFHKIDDRSAPLSGATFTITGYDFDGQPILFDGNPTATLTTDSSGYSPWLESLPEGIYEYQETQAPANFSIDSNTYYFYVTDGRVMQGLGEEGVEALTITKRNITVVPTNIHLKFAKTDEFDNPLPDAEFAIYQWDAQNNVYDYSAPVDIPTYDDSEEVFISGDLVATYNNEGNFVLIETSTPDGYCGEVYYEFNIYDDELDITDNPFVNESNGLYIYKVDEETGEAIEGAVFQIELYEDYADAGIIGNEVSLDPTITASMEFTTSANILAGDLAAGSYYLRINAASNDADYTGVGDPDGNATMLVEVRDTSDNLIDSFYLPISETTVLPITSSTAIGSITVYGSDTSTTSIGDRGWFDELHLYETTEPAELAADSEFEMTTDYRGIARLAPGSGGSTTKGIQLTPSIKNLPKNSMYKITEISCPGGYIVDPTPHFVYVDENGKVNGSVIEQLYVTNRKDDVADLMIGKHVEGNLGNKHQQFTFNVTISGVLPEEEYPLTIGRYDDSDESYTETSTTVTSDANGVITTTITLAHHDEAHISNIPTGATYTITETGASDYATKTYTRSMAAGSAPETGGGSR